MSKEILKELEKYDTPSITNIVATYPANKAACLGLYHPWTGKWYTDERLKCFFPELGPCAGYAITCVYGLPDPHYGCLKLVDLLRAIKNSPQPVILAVKQNFPDDYKRIAGLLGGNMMTMFKMCGVTGVLSDGPSRDLDEVRSLGMQYMLTGVTAGHGDFELQAINVPVEICGMIVAPGDIVHMDENGAVKFPAEYLTTVAERTEIFCRNEMKNQALMQETTDPEELVRLLGG